MVTGVWAWSQKFRRAQARASFCLSYKKILGTPLRGCDWHGSLNKVVVGNKIHDVTYQHPDSDNPGSIISYAWPWSFSAAIASYSDNNMLVANNLIAKSTTSKKTTVVLDTEKLTVPYLVDNRYGIDVAATKCCWEE